MWLLYGGGRYGGAVSGISPRGSGSRSWPTTGSQSHGSVTPGRATASPSNTQGMSRVPELGPLGSVRGALSNGRPYRDPLAEGLLAGRYRSGQAASRRTATPRFQRLWASR